MRGVFSAANASSASPAGSRRRRRPPVDDRADPDPEHTRQTLAGGSRADGPTARRSGDAPRGQTRPAAAHPGDPGAGHRHLRAGGGVRRDPVRTVADPAQRQAVRQCLPAVEGDGGPRRPRQVRRDRGVPGRVPDADAAAGRAGRSSSRGGGVVTRIRRGGPRRPARLVADAGRDGARDAGRRPTPAGHRREIIVCRARGSRATSLSREWLPQVARYSFSTARLFLDER